MDVTLSPQCAQGLHNFCGGRRDSCACSDCHLGPCTSCGTDNLQRMYDDDDASARLCAACKREHAKSRQKFYQTKCDKCGAAPAFRNPELRDATFLCAACHGDAGGVNLAGSVAHLAATCKGLDVADPAHVWVQVRGSKFACAGCPAKKYDDKLQQQRRREIERDLF